MGGRASASTVLFLRRMFCRRIALRISGMLRLICCYCSGVVDPIATHPMPCHCIPSPHCMQLHPTIPSMPPYPSPSIIQSRHIPYFSFHPIFPIYLSSRPVPSYITHPILSHPKPFHPITYFPPHPIPSHPISSHPKPSHSYPKPFHPIPSPLIPSHAISSPSTLSHSILSYPILTSSHLMHLPDVSRGARRRRVYG